MNESITSLLPDRLKAALERMPGAVIRKTEEIRIREGRPFEIGYRGSYAFVRPDGTLTTEPTGGLVPSREECGRLLDRLTRHSLYSFEEELKRGYITVSGGHRVGLSGKTVLEGGRVRHIRDISGFNIRIAREVPECGSRVLSHLLDHGALTVHHTLVVSPPQQGKTTLIRDLARLVSYGYWPPLTFKGGRKVGIVDERSEIAACTDGIPRFDVGPRTDVLDGCPKAEGMMMLIRSMSPEVLVVDEIGRDEDAVALREAMHAGIRVIASAHGQSFDDLRRRPALRELCREQLFSRYVLLSKADGQYGIQSVLDESGRPLAEAGSEGAS
jgi:stage III sporulation protein AA